MYEEIRQLWRSMAKRELFHADLYLYYEKPIKGKGYHGGGEFYLYTADNRYCLSYSERGTEDIIVFSEDFIDIKFEIAFVMTSHIVDETIKIHKRKYKNGLNQEARVAMQLELLNNADKELYQRAIENYKKYGTLRVWKDNY